MRLMRRSGKHTPKFLVDTNVFIAAIKTPGKALELVMELVDKRYDLVGNPYLLDEYVRFSREIPSDLAGFLLAEMSGRFRIVDVAERFVTVCRPYFPPGEAVDVLLAATCLQEGAVLITNDKHFGRISEAGVIEVWSVPQAIEALL